VVAATVLGVAAISTLDGGSQGGPLSQQEVSDRLAETPRTPGGASAPAVGSGTAAAATASPSRRYFTTSGGSLWATCAAGRATLDTLTPRSGYRLDGYEPGPAGTAWVRFKRDVQRGHATEYHVTVTCPAGVPRLAETTDG
jgi:hypothetical protein